MSRRRGTAKEPDYAALNSTPTRNEQVVVAAQKTVAIFSAIIGRELILRHTEERSATDGTTLYVNLYSKTVYQDVEHKLFHILFGSDARAGSLFVREYAKRIFTVARANGVEISQETLLRVLSFIVATLEDHRVNSLGGLIYPGAVTVIREQKRALIGPHSRNAQHSLMLLMSCVANGVLPEDGALDKYKPLFEKALSKVERRGYLATLTIAKWLVTNTVRLIAETVHRDEEGVPGDGSYSPDVADRSAAMGVLLDMAVVPDPLHEHISDVNVPTHCTMKSEAAARKMAEDALNADVHDDGAEALLTATEGAMSDALEQVSERIRQEVSHDDWLRRDVPAAVRFVDVLVPTPITLNAQDRATAHRLRSMFLRVLGRRSVALEDAGSEVEVPEYVQYVATGEPRPFFRRETSGRGFRALTLVDLSTSMGGVKVEQAERATNTLEHGLKFPFTHRETWGFCSPHDGEVQITRFNGVPFDGATAARIDGSTPLHAAVRMAVRHLEGRTETCHLFIVTDGEPHYSTRGGTSIGQGQLMSFIHADVLRARRKGIGVTAIILDTELGPKALTYMFGPHHWKVVKAETLGRDLTAVVADSFIRYLKAT